MLAIDYGAYALSELVSRDTKRIDTNIEASFADVTTFVNTIWSFPADDEDSWSWISYYFVFFV